VKVTVVSPLECKLKVTPSTLKSTQQWTSILACIRFPDGFTGTDADDDAALLIHPGALPAMRRWAANDESNHLSLFAFFSRNALADEVKSGPTELTVVGTLRSGRVFYGRCEVEIIGKGK
jgi:hypothetical protein